MPIIGGLCDGLQSMYMARGGDAEERERCLDSIKERQTAIEDEC